MDVTLNSKGEAFDQQGLGASKVEKLEPAASQLQGLAAKVTEGYEIDINSLSHMKKGWEECEKLVAMLPESKGGRFDGAANVNLPVVLNAAIVFNARAYEAFFKSNDIVKCEVIGDDSGLFQIQTDPQTGQPNILSVLLAPDAKAKRAVRISQHMSWQITYKMPYWLEDMDRLLMLIPIYGCLFKKIYYNSYTKSNCVELIMPQYLTVHAETKNLMAAPRITHNFGLYPYEIQERIRSGYFDEFTYTNEDFGEQHAFLEQHMRYDLDGDGYDEPLIVTVHKESSSVVRVEKRYIEADVIRDDEDEVIRIEGENFFVKYGFMQNPTGGFYDIGVGYVLYQISKSINTTVNQLLDAGTLANSGFFLLERGRMKGGEVKVRPGFGLFVNNDSRPLKDSIYQMQFGGPDSVLFQLLGFLFDYARNLGGMREVLEGAVRSDQTTGAVAQQTENGISEYKAIYKRIWRAQSHEFKRLFDLNHRYLDEKEYFKVLDDQEIMGKAGIMRQDYNSDDYDVMPIADEEYLTSGQKTAKASLAYQLAKDGMVSPKVATKMILQANNFDNIDELMDFQPTDQQAQAQMQQQQIQMADIQLKMTQLQERMFREQNMKRKLDLEEVKTLVGIDKTRAETIDTLAQAQERGHNADLGALDIISQNLQSENEKRIAEVEAMSAQQGVGQPQGQSQGQPTPQQ